MDEHWRDLMAIYALGGATEEEAAYISRLVETDGEAAAYLSELQETVDVLPFTAVAMPVSTETTAAVMARVAPEAAPAQQSASMPAPAPKTPSRPGLWQQLQALWQRPAFAATAVALAAIMLVWALTLQQQVNTLNSQMTALDVDAAATTAALSAENETLTANNTTLAAEVAVLQAENAALTDEVAQLADETVALRDARDAAESDLAALAGTVAEMETAVAEQQAMQTFFNSPTLYTVSLPGTDAYPEAEAQLVVDPDSSMAMLVVAGMDPLPQDNVYQVLLIRGTEHETAETFRVSTDGGGVLLVHSEEPIDSFDAVGVSVEPDGGSVQRTGEIVVLGNFVN